MSACNSQIDFKKFPTTRYQGSKRKIVPWLHAAVGELKFDTVLDACGGTASVSYLFKKMGKTVTYNDKLSFNYLIGKALIENQHYKLNNNDLENIIQVNPNVTYKKFIEKTFEGFYYLKAENKWLDRAVSNIIYMNHYQPHVLEYKKALAFYSIFQASLIKRPFNLFHRKNLNLRTADVERSFGNKTTWEKSFDEYLVKFSCEVNSLVFNSNKKCKALNQSIFNIDSYGYDLVYIDPPYLRKDGSNESSNYLKCYHFLEGLANYELWGDLIDETTINQGLKDAKASNDFTKSNIHEAIEEILTNFRNSKIVFSYKFGGIPSIDFIVKKMKKLKRNVYTVSTHYKYALNHQNGDANKNREVLIIGI